MSPLFVPNCVPSKAANNPRPPTWRAIVANAAVGVTYQHSSEPVHGDVVEVQQVAAWIASPLVPDAAALYGVGWSCINSGPSVAGIVGESYVQVPDSLEVGRLRVTGSLRAQESKGCAIVVAGDHFRKFRILDSKRSSGILRL